MHCCDLRGNRTSFIIRPKFLVSLSVGFCHWPSYEKYSMHSLGSKKPKATIPKVAEFYYKGKEKTVKENYK